MPRIPLVIASAAGAWQSVPTFCHCERRRRVAIRPSRRDAHWASAGFAKSHRPRRSWHAHPPCHCERRRRVAIRIPLVIARPVRRLVVAIRTPLTDAFPQSFRPPRNDTGRQSPSSRKPSCGFLILQGMKRLLSSSRDVPTHPGPL